MILAMLLSLAACGGGKSPTPETTKADVTTEAPETTAASPLDFLQDGEMYFDIEVSSDVIKDFSVSTDGKTLGSDNKLTYKAGSEFEVTGTGKADAKVLLLIISVENDGNHFQAVHDYSTGDADDVMQLLPRKLSRVKGTKTCVILTEDVKIWNKNLSPALNNFMENTVFPGVKK